MLCITNIFQIVSVWLELQIYKLYYFLIEVLLMARYMKQALVRLVLRLIPIIESGTHVILSLIHDPFYVMTPNFHEDFMVNLTTYRLVLT